MPQVFLASVVGGDAQGEALLAHADSAGLSTRLVDVLPEARTATYTAIHDRNGEMVGGVADMSIFERMDERFMGRLEEAVGSAALVVCDANLSHPTFQRLMSICAAEGTTVLFDGTSDPKSVLPVLTDTLSHIDVLKVNAGELREMAMAALAKGMFGQERRRDVVFALQSAHCLSSLISLAVFINQLQCLDGITYPILGKHVFVTLGPQGVLWVGVGSEGNRRSASFAAAPIEAGQVVSASGAGDCFLSAIACGLLRGMTLDVHEDDAIVRRALVIARDSLLSRGAVPTSFSI